MLINSFIRKQAKADQIRYGTSSIAAKTDSFEKAKVVKPTDNVKNTEITKASFMFCRIKNTGDQIMFSRS